MTRPARNRLLLLTLWALCLAAGGTLPRVVSASLVAALLSAAAFSYWVARDFFAGRRAQRRRDWVQALNCFQRFEQSLGEKPSRQRWSFLAAGIYSSDAVAIARNNVGVVHLENGQLELAQALFRSALQRDPDYAVPHVNLAVVAARRHDAAAVDAQLSQASALGITGKKTHARVRALLTAA